MISFAYTPRHALYPRRLGAWRWEAVPSLRPVNTERAETRRKYETGGTRLSRPMGGTDADGVRPRQARPSRVLDLYDNPIISRPLSIRSFPVPLQWVKQRASQPQNQSPCPRASARSGVTGRRPRDVPAPPRRVARKGGTSRNREAVPPGWDLSITQHPSHLPVSPPRAEAARVLRERTRHSRVPSPVLPEHGGLAGHIAPAVAHAADLLGILLPRLVVYVLSL